MTTDLEDLVRSTLAGRAALVTDGPEWAARPAHHRVNRWLVAAAAAAVVGTAGAALVATQVLRHRGTEAAAGSVRPTCTTALPRAWKQALGRPAWQVEGMDAWPAASAKDGTVVAEALDGRRAEHFVRLGTDGRPTPLLTVPRTAHRTVSGVDTDGRYAVVNLVTGTDANVPAGDVLLIDSRTGTRTHLLPHVPAPKGYVVAWRGAVIQAGTVYWGMTEPAKQPHHGIVVGYDIARRSYRVLAHLNAMPLVLRDPRGVHWQGGLVPAKDVPSGVPAAPRTMDWRQSVVSDGTAYAWQGPTDGPDSQVVFWLHGKDERHWRVVRSQRQGNFIASTVSGPFVFGAFSYGGKPYVLDMRTGAMATLGSAHVDGAEAVGSRVFVDVQAGRPVNTVSIDISTLPELRC